MKTIIRLATQADFPAIFSLVEELAEFEKAPEKLTNTLELMRREKEHIHCFVAESETKEIVGMVQYFYAYFTWSGKSLYVGDLCVKKSYRGKKIGLGLLTKIFELAKKENCKRVTWQVLDWNQPAIEFYRKLGAELDKEWINCNFYPKEIREFSKTAKSLSSANR